MNPAKTALITGGAKRIGAALVEALHQQGMNIIFQYHSSNNQAQNLLNRLNRKRKNSVIGVCADLQSFNTYQTLAEAVETQFGQLDVLINNAAGFFPTPIDQAKEVDWDKLMTVNAKAPFFLVQNCHALLRKNQGCIINITDVYADKPVIDYSIYCASKAALTSLTLSMAQSYAPEIRVNAIAPGAILAPENDPQTAMQSVIDKTPLKRLGGTDAVVETALFLINNASFITGQVLNVDGGRTSIAP